MEDEADCLMYELRAPIRTQNARTAAIEARVQEHAAEAAKRIAYFHSPAVQWDFSQFEADFVEHVDYCLIPYMMPPLTLKLTKTRYVPESGTILPNGDIAF
jgi:hypothetical protein